MELDTIGKMETYENICSVFEGMVVLVGDSDDSVYIKCAVGEEEKLLERVKNTKLYKSLSSRGTFKYDNNVGYISDREYGFNATIRENGRVWMSCKSGAHMDLWEIIQFLYFKSIEKVKKAENELYASLDESYKTVRHGMVSKSRSGTSVIYTPAFGMVTITAGGATPIQSDHSNMSPLGYKYDGCYETYMFIGDERVELKNLPKAGLPSGVFAYEKSVRIGKFISYLINNLGISKVKAVEIVKATRDMYCNYPTDWVNVLRGIGVIDYHIDKIYAYHHLDGCLHS